MTILDRYVLKKFLVPFIYCIFGFIAIWLVFDLSDNGPDFLEGKVPLSTVIEFYKTQVPEVIVISLPIGTLLALLYSLTQMSRTNEIVAMLTAGTSIVRIILPLLGVGLVLVGISMYFNYEQAPHAAAIKKQMLRDIKRGKKTEPGLSGHAFRNREQYRTWFMRRINQNDYRIYDATVIQQDEKGNFLKQWSMRQAQYYPQADTWVLDEVRLMTYGPDGKINYSEVFPRLKVQGEWNETPWRIASSVMNADYLSVEELREYLLHNHDFPKHRLAPYRTQLAYRWALPWVNLLVVILAAPLGIVYSRRGILGGVALAIGLFFSLVFISSLTIALGKGSHIPPFAAAWGPLIAYFLIALVLLWMKSTNRDLQNLRIPGF